MKKLITASVASLALVASVQSIAEGTTSFGVVTPADVAAANSMGTTGTSAYGAQQYTAQYEISDLLSAVAEDVSVELNAFLGMALQRETAGEQQAGDDRGDIASAY